MKVRNSIGLATAAAALAVGLAALPAAAFDDTTWTWTKTQTDDGSRSADSWLWAFPDGETAVESDQKTFGNIGADATIGTQIVPPSATANDASLDLPAIEGTAGAYGNVISVESEVPISADISQYHAGGYDPTAAATADTTAITDSTLATATDPVIGTGDPAADQMTSDARSGVLLPHQTTATVTATGIDQATVDIEARAISNSSSMVLRSDPATDAVLLGDGGATLDGGEPALYPRSTNALVISDETQFSFGDTSASANSTQTITNMNNLGTLDGPVNRVGATAIGNLSTRDVKFKTPEAPAN